MIYGSVCSGIEAATMAWHPLGFRPAWFCEIEPFPSAVLAHHYPEVPNYGDFTRLLSKEHPRSDVDVLVGGTPCQAFSIAGLRAGLADPRGNLALAFVALVDALRPRWVVWENVPGVLSVDGGRAFGSFLGGLGELGYGWAYRVMDAQYVGLAQRRKRVFVVASPGDWRRSAAVLFEPDRLRRDSPPSRETGAGVAGSVGAGPSGHGWRIGAEEAASGHAVAVDLQNGRTGGNVAGTLDTTRPGRGGSQAVMTAYNVHGGNANARERHAYPTEVARCVDSFGGFAPNQGGTVVAFGGGNTQGALSVATAVNAGGTGRLDFDLAHTLRGTGHDASEDGTGRGVPLVPVSMVQTRGSNIDVGPISGTLGSNADRASGGSPCVTSGLGVRRLMPHELERLQGFPDHFTQVPYRRKPAADGPRSKALGNSMAVPVMAWIGRRLLLVDATPTP